MNYCYDVESTAYAKLLNREAEWVAEPVENPN